MKYAAGTLLICTLTDRFLLVKRSDTVGSYEHTWATVGGSIDEGEEPLESAKRELYEETKIDPDKVDFQFFEEQYLNGVNYFFHLGFVEEELGCILNGENTDWGWFDMETLPEPLIPTLYPSLLRIV